MKIKIMWIGIAVVGLVFGAYVAWQQPKVWCNKQWAGVALLRGGYRSWTVSFCDGQTWLDNTGKLYPVVVTTNGYRKGFYRFPKFNHVDVRKLGIRE